MPDSPPPGPPSSDTPAMVMTCPRCGATQPTAPECVACGVVIRKWFERQERSEAPDSGGDPAPSASAPPRSGRRRAPAATSSRASGAPGPSPARAGAPHPSPSPAAGRAVGGFGAAGQRPQGGFTRRPDRPSRPLIPPGPRPLMRAADSLRRLAKTGIPLPEAFRTVAGRGRVGRGTLGTALHDIAKRLDGGATASDACLHHPAVFSRADAMLLRAAERTGDVTSAFAAISDRHSRALEIRKSLSRSAAYPMVLLGASFLLLPLTNLVQGTVDDVVRDIALNYAVAFAVAFSLFVGLPWALRHTRLGPLLRTAGWATVWPLNIYALWARAAYARALGRLLEAGLPMWESLSIAATIRDDPELEARGERALARVQAGEPLAEPLVAEGVFHADDQPVLAGGERSGTLVESLGELADDYTDRAESRTRWLMRIGAVLLTLSVMLYVAYQVLMGFKTVTAPTMDMLDELERSLPYLRP